MHSKSCVDFSIIATPCIPDTILFSSNNTDTMLLNSYTSSSIIFVTKNILIKRNQYFIGVSLYFSSVGFQTQCLPGTKIKRNYMNRNEHQTNGKRNMKLITKRKYNDDDDYNDDYNNNNDNNISIITT